MASSQREDQIQFARIAYLLHNSAASSCTCCIDPSFKLQGNLLQADFFSGESGTITTASKSRHKQWTKLLFKNLSSRYCCTVPVLHLPALDFFAAFKKCELQTDYMLSAHAHRATCKCLLTISDEKSMFTDLLRVLGRRFNHVSTSLRAVWLCSVVYMWSSWRVVSLKMAPIFFVGYLYAKILITAPMYLVFL